MCVNFNSKYCLFFFALPKQIKRATRKRYTTRFKGNFDLTKCNCSEQQEFADRLLVGYNLVY